MKAHPGILSCLLTIAFQEKIPGRAIYIEESKKITSSYVVYNVNRFENIYFICK